MSFWNRGLLDTILGLQLFHVPHVHGSGLKFYSKLCMCSRVTVVFVHLGNSGVINVWSGNSFEENLLNLLNHSLIQLKQIQCVLRNYCVCMCMSCDQLGSGHVTCPGQSKTAYTAAM